MALLESTEGNLQALVNEVGKASELFGLSLNAKKTQVKIIGRHTSRINIMYNGAPLAQVKQLIYFVEQALTNKDIPSRW